MTAIIATAILVKTPIYLYIFIAETVQIFLNNVTIQLIVREKEAFIDINMCIICNNNKERVDKISGYVCFKHLLSLF